MELTLHPSGDGDGINVVPMAAKTPHVFHKSPQVAIMFINS